MYKNNPSEEGNFTGKCNVKVPFVLVVNSCCICPLQHSTAQLFWPCCTRDLWCRSPWLCNHFDATTQRTKEAISPTHVWLWPEFPCRSAEIKSGFSFFSVLQLPATAEHNIYIALLFLYILQYKPQANSESYHIHFIIPFCPSSGDSCGRIPTKAKAPSTWSFEGCIFEWTMLHPFHPWVWL